MTMLMQGPAAPAIDRHEALMRVDGDGEFLKELAQILLNECPSSMAALREMVARRDGQGVRRIAHTIKGAVANFGAERAYEKARALELAGEKEDLTDVEELFATFEAEMRRVAGELQELVSESTI